MDFDRSVFCTLHHRFQWVTVSLRPRRAGLNRPAARAERLGIPSRQIRDSGPEIPGRSVRARSPLHGIPGQSLHGSGFGSVSQATWDSEAENLRFSVNFSCRDVRPLTVHSAPPVAAACSPLRVSCPQPGGGGDGGGALRLPPHPSMAVGGAEPGAAVDPPSIGVEWFAVFYSHGHHWTRLNRAGTSGGGTVPAQAATGATSASPPPPPARHAVTALHPHSANSVAPRTSMADLESQESATLYSRGERKAITWPQTSRT